MTDSPVTWVIAALEVITALGIAVYWIMWFRSSHDEPWLPDGYIDHEAPFVFTDTILAVLLVVAAVLQVTDEPATSAAVLVSAGRPVGESLGLIAAGMLLFLGVLDLAYFARTGLFRREHGGVVNAGVVIGTLTLAAILIVRFV
jgi:hypothetical protein